MHCGSGGPSSRSSHGAVPVQMILGRLECLCSRHVQTTSTGIEQITVRAGRDHTADKVVVELEHEMGPSKARETTSWQRPGRGAD